MKYLAFAALASVNLLGIIGYTQSLPEKECKVVWSKEASSCVWELIEIQEPLLVKTVQGTLANEGGGLWPNGVNAVIEIANMQNHSIRYMGHAHIPSGRFSIRNVPPGDYCFRVGIYPAGWCCVQGQILVSRAASSKSRIKITVPLGK